MNEPVCYLCGYVVNADFPRAKFKGHVCHACCVLRVKYDSDHPLLLPSPYRGKYAHPVEQEDDR